MDTLEVPDAATADERRSLLDGHVPVMYGSGLADAESGRRPRTAPLLERITLTSSRMGGYVGKKTATVLSSNSFSILLLFLPLGIASGVLGWSDVAIFACNFCAIIPLAAVLSFATEELALQVGDTLGGLINATFGNAVELIVSIIALAKGEIRIVQASMLGSILSNILFVLGMCFFLGGLRFHEQRFNKTAASTMSTLMAVSTGALMIPTALHTALQANVQVEDGEVHSILLRLSRGTSMVMLFLYVMYLFFQLRSHGDMFSGAATESEHEDTPALTVWEASFVLLLVTLLVSVCANYLVGSIEGLVETTGISKTFVGIILIPIVGNAVEHTTAIIVAMKDKMDLAIGIAIGSSMQVALLLLPFVVILGWIIDQPMSLHFQPFETIVLFISTYLAYMVVQDGKSNYLEGAMLLGIYVMISLLFFLCPDSGLVASP